MTGRRPLRVKRLAAVAKPASSARSGEKASKLNPQRWKSRQAKPAAVANRTKKAVVFDSFVFTALQTCVGIEQGIMLYFPLMAMTERFAAPRAGARERASKAERCLRRLTREVHSTSRNLNGRHAAE